MTDAASHDGLRPRVVLVDGRRTSVRLDSYSWEALREIAKREGRTVHDICTEAGRSRSPELSLSCAIRVLLLRYFRQAMLNRPAARARRLLEPQLDRLS